MKAVVFNGSGGEEVVQVVERPTPTPDRHEVLVRVGHAALNPADIAQREGRYPAPPGVPADVPGLEVGGVVERSGSAVERWRPGDRVMGIVAGGGLAELVIAHEGCLVPIPDNMDDAHAAAAPESFVTAHDALTWSGGFRPGDRVLVNGANGGVGSAAVQIVRSLGGDPVGTCRSLAGQDFIRDLGATPITQQDFLARDGVAVREFDVIVELVGGPNLARDVDVLAPRGRIVVVGVPAGDQLEFSVRTLMTKRASIVGTTLRHRRLEDKILAVRAFEHEVLPLLANGRVQVFVEAVYPWTLAVEAFRRISSSGKRGKVLIDFHDDSPLPESMCDMSSPTSQPARDRK